MGFLDVLVVDEDLNWVSVYEVLFVFGWWLVLVLFVEMMVVCWLLCDVGEEIFEGIISLVYVDDYVMKKFVGVFWVCMVDYVFV